MKNKNNGSEKLLNAALLAALCVAPLASGTVAQAAPPDHGRRDHDSNQSHDRAKGHANNQSHASNRSHVTPQPQNHRPNQSHTANRNHSAPPPQNHPPYQSHETNHNRAKPPVHHVAPSPHQNWRRTNNNHYDDNWHRSHGYTRNGSRWYWHGHDDDYWIGHGYGWNGSLWIILNGAHNNYGSYRTFEGIVTRVNYGGNELDVRINGNTYNVYASTRLPGRLNRGDLVRVYGQRYGNNDIRNSSVRILRNR